MSSSAAARRTRCVGGVAIAVALVALVGPALPASADASRAAAHTPAKPDLTAAVHYLTTTTGANGVVGGTSLTRDGYYDAFDQFGDFGLTIDGAFALAAARTDNATLKKVVGFIDAKKTDASGRSIDDWTGIGAAFASGGAIGKEALLAEITGYDPHDFGGHDLITALEHTVCTKTDVPNGCAGPGNYLYSASTFSQSLGVIAELRAGGATRAAPAIAYLESLQNASGAWPSLLPSSGDSDVDSTALAVMALALLPKDATASAAVNKAMTWIASRQRPTGGFSGVAADSTNSSGLAIQALTLAGTTYASQIAQATAFVAGEQNADGGFNADASDPHASDVRASAQAVGGVVGTSLGALTDVLPRGGDGGGVSTGGTTVPSTSTSTSTSVTTSTSTSSTTLAATDPSVSTAELPATGAGADRSLAWAVGLLVLGVGATVAGRRRRGRA